MDKTVIPVMTTLFLIQCHNYLLATNSNITNFDGASTNEMNGIINGDVNEDDACNNPDYLEFEQQILNNKVDFKKTINDIAT